MAVFLSSGALELTAGSAPRVAIDLGGSWRFQTNGAPEGSWKSVRVPSDFESHEGTGFDGVGWYRRELPERTVPASRRVLLHFQAAATETAVWVDDQRVGGHLGGWTPFRVDVTDALRARGGDSNNQVGNYVYNQVLRARAGAGCRELRVRVDEKVGHNTQGFLPIVQPHFGGLWQDVTWLEVPAAYVDDLRLRATGNPATGQLELEIPVGGDGAAAIEGLTVRWGLRGASRRVTTRLRLGEDERAVGARLWREGNTLHARIPVSGPRLWSPADPNLYDVEIRLTDAAGRPGDRVRVRSAFRTFEAVGRQLRINGQPLNLRGLLNWGYYPPNLAPNPDEGVFRRDLAFARDRGFNLMKFCLWVPPRRFLELADEMGMLTWMEYPTWHPRLTPEFREALEREFTEFFHYDRNCASVILRSLTCETGPGADLDVIRSLYDKAHRLIPGALVEDDSSWIEWNRITDFYDDHPYGNNHTWVPTLRRLDEYVSRHAPKPLVLGESISADTWPRLDALEARSETNRPYWFPKAFDAQRRWLEQVPRTAGAEGLDRLREDSLRYGLLMRKYQAETFRREIPDGGYVISVIRDVPIASMGLLDYLGAPKWPATDWAWQRDTALILETGNDRRSFAAGSTLTGRVWISHYGGKALRNGRLRVWIDDGGPKRRGARSGMVEATVNQEPGTARPGLDLALAVPAIDDVPRRLDVCAVLEASDVKVRNAWSVWAIPAPAASVPESSMCGNRGRQVQFGPCRFKPTPPAFEDSALARRGREGPERPEGIMGSGTSLGLRCASLGEVFAHPSLAESVTGLLPAGVRVLGEDRTTGGEAVWVTARLDDAVAGHLETGGRVLWLPDNGKGSLKLVDHWFLRGAPYVRPGSLGDQIPRDLWVELQHFDLAGRVIPDLPWLDQIDPLLMLWDTHDHGTVKTHGLVFETRVGRGRLLVSALNHGGPDNAVGRWLLGVFLEHLRSGLPPRNQWSEDLWRGFKARLHRDVVALTERPWRFQPEPRGGETPTAWATAGFDDSAWPMIKVGQHWESQGYAALDGWAWYRLRVVVPASWEGRPVYLTFEGVDDLYELYVDGRLAAQRGDLATRKDTFNETFSHDLSAVLRPGRESVIAVRVHDWYGAGGIFRPVTLGTTPHDPGTELLQ